MPCLTHSVQLCIIYTVDCFYYVFYRNLFISIDSWSNFFAVKVSHPHSRQCPQRMIRSHAASLALHDNPSPHTNRLATCISFYICCSKACLLGAPRQPITTVSCLKLALAPKQLGACSVAKCPRMAQAISSFQFLPGPVNRRAVEAKNCA